MDKTLIEIIKKACAELDVSFNDDFDTIRKKYHKLVKVFHPDNNMTGDPEKDEKIIEECEKKIKKINSAMDVIERNYNQIMVHPEIFFDEKEENNDLSENTTEDVRDDVTEDVNVESAESFSENFDNSTEDDNYEKTEDFSSYSESGDILPNVYFELYKKRSDRARNAFENNKLGKIFNKNAWSKFIDDSPLLFFTEEDAVRVKKFFDEFDINNLKWVLLDKYGTLDLDTFDICDVYKSILYEKNLPLEITEVLCSIIYECQGYYHELKKESVDLTKKFIKREKYDIDEIFGTVFLFPKMQDSIYYLINKVTPSEYEGNLKEYYQNNIFGRCLDILSLGEFQIKINEDTDVTMNYLSVLKKHKNNFYQEFPSATTEDFVTYLNNTFNQEKNKEI